MKPALTALLLASFFLVTGCATTVATTVPKGEIADIYGPPPPKDYKREIKMAFAKTFLEVKAPIYKFDPPMTGHASQNRTIAIKDMYGWVVCGTVNGRQGGLAGYATYAGPVPFFVIFKNGKIVEQLIGQASDDAYVYNRYNGVIEQTCANPLKPLPLD